MEALMQYHGVLCSSWLYCLGVVVAALALGYFGLPFIVWYVAILATAFLMGASNAVIIGLAVVLGIFVVPPIRKAFVSSVVMKIMGTNEFTTTFPDLFQYLFFLLEWLNVHFYFFRPSFINFFCLYSHLFLFICRRLVFWTAFLLL